MTTAKEFAKTLIVKTCSPGLQQKIRELHTVYQITRNKHFREPEMEILGRLIPQGAVVADVGANVGVYTHALALAVGAKGKVYSFEPVGHNYAILTALTRRTRLFNVVPINAAVGSKAAETEMLIPDMEGFTGYYWAHVAIPGEAGRRERVRVVRLDDMLRDGVLSGLHFIKCDVEGGELEVLLGAQEILRNHKPGCLIEVSKPTSARVFELFHQNGYRAFVLDGKLVETRHYRDREFSNYFFLHPASKTWERMSHV
jgi:FkbM family methyltransferase